MAAQTFRDVGVTAPRAIASRTVGSQPTSLAGRYIGRVGALAVALGVGAAVATGQGMGIARADDDPGTNANSSSADSPSNPPSPTSGDHDDEQAPSTGPDTEVDLDTADGDDESVNDEGQSTEDDDDDEDVTAATPTPEATPEQQPPAAGSVDQTPEYSSAPKKQMPQHASTNPVRSDAPLPDNVTPTGTPDMGNEAEPMARTMNTGVPERALASFAPAVGFDDRPLVTTGGDELAFATIANTSVAQTENAAMGLPGTLVGVASTLVSIFLSPFLGTAPTTPAEPPLLWAVLAFVRREIQRTFFNTTPDAVDNTATTDEDTPKVIDVLGNDTDAEGDTVSVTAVSTPTNGGSVSINPDGTITYTPGANAQALALGEQLTDTFTYTVRDGGFNVVADVLGFLTGRGPRTDTATVSVTVTGVNDAPVAGNDTGTVAEGAGNTTTINATGNDTDADGTIDQTSIVIVQQPSHGFATADPDGSITYIHNGGEQTSDSFTYTVTDDLGAISNTATVTITITPVNDPPRATNDTATVAEGGTVSIPATANDTDADGTINPTSLTITAQPANGTASVNADGTITYTHNGTETTSDSLQYTVTDNTGAVSNTATVTITITPVNDAPVAGNDTGTVTEGAGNTTTINVTGNDTDADADGTIDQTSIVIVQQPSHGFATADPDGSITYIHNGGEQTSDSFTYTVADNLGAVSNTATVTITITPVNDAPVAVNDTATTDEDNPVVIAGVLTNDTDAEGDSLTVDSLTPPANGTVTFDAATQRFTYTPNLNFNGTDSFTYRASDGTDVSSASATVTITVNSVNDPPVVGQYTYTARNGFLDVRTRDQLFGRNDFDPDGTVAVVTGINSFPANSETFLNRGSGSFLYQAQPGFVGTDSFTYISSDSFGATTIGTVTIIVPPPEF